MIRGVKFVSIPVVDQDRALAFYTEKLGFRVATDQPFDDKQRWIELAIPGAETGVVLFSHGRGTATGRVHECVVVDRRCQGDGQDAEGARCGIHCRGEERGVGHLGDIQGFGGKPLCVELALSARQVSGCGQRIS
jgi:catechol 2,3-dioxygenase-like lactoylglutathione lyase family enzyme